MGARSSTASSLSAASPASSYPSASVPYDPYRHSVAMSSGTQSAELLPTSPPTSSSLPLLPPSSESARPMDSAMHTGGGTTSSMMMMAGTSNSMLLHAGSGGGGGGGGIRSPMSMSSGVGVGPSSALGWSTGVGRGGVGGGMGMGMGMGGGGMGFFLLRRLASAFSRGKRKQSRNRQNRHPSSNGGPGDASEYIRGVPMHMEHDRYASSHGVGGGEKGEGKQRSDRMMCAEVIQTYQSMLAHPLTPEEWKCALRLTHVVTCASFDVVVNIPRVGGQYHQQGRWGGREEMAGTVCLRLVYPPPRDGSGNVRVNQQGRLEYNGAQGIWAQFIVEDRNPPEHVQALADRVSQQIRNDDIPDEECLSSKHSMHEFGYDSDTFLRPHFDSSANMNREKQVDVDCGSMQNPDNYVILSFKSKAHEDGAHSVRNREGDVFSGLYLGCDDSGGLIGDAGPSIWSDFRVESLIHALDVEGFEDFGESLLPNGYEGDPSIWYAPAFSFGVDSPILRHLLSVSRQRSQETASIERPLKGGDFGMLSLDQRRQFLLNGFVHVPNVVPLHLLNAALAVINRQLGRPVPEGGMSRNEDGHVVLTGSIGSHPAILDLLFKSKAWDYAQELIGKSRIVRPGGAQVALRFPEEEPLDVVSLSRHPPSNNSWHIDGMDKGRVTPFTLLFGITLSDCDAPHAGNFTVFPGSHLVLQHVVANRGLDDALSPSGRASLDLGEPFRVHSHAGDIVMAHPKTAHRGGENWSPHIRYQVYFRFHHVEYENLWEQAWLIDPFVEFEGLSQDRVLLSEDIESHTNFLCSSAWSGRK